MDQSQREQEIFKAALELGTPEERRGFVRGTCGGDQELLQKVEALLAGYYASQSYVPTAYAPASAPREPSGPQEGPGSVLGHYKLLQKIGEGGCGVVYMAEQAEPVRRRVALKIIKLGMDTRNVIARFEAERQALALMEHANIAKVLDAGATESGRPYFVMELVRGIKITEYCDQNNLAPRERLELFIQVCHAIQHAHQKGIIHRDIKPSNILVSLHDGAPVPVVIDFGIAKATEQPLTDKTMFTAFEQFIGTPAYMSPEQAELSRLDIDTRSDIYSLGVLLYELLTGKTPFDSTELLAAGVEGMRRTIREQEPVRPSTRLGRLVSEDLTTTAKRRRTEAPKLIHLVRGDLDWIVMKCLEKDRTRRYETANGLASDVGRYLNQEPVLARPPTTAYKVQKFIRRNKVMVGAAGLVVAALLLGILVSTWQAVRATRAEKTAQEKTRLAEGERLRAGEAAQLAQREKARAEKGEQAAKESGLLSRQQAYAADMNLAQQALAANDLGRTGRLLNAHRPQPGEVDLRGWEWRYLWRECRGDALSVLCRRSNDVYSVAYSPDGNMLAMAGLYENFVEIWDVPGRRRIAVLQTNTGSVVAFSPRGNLLATDTATNYHINIWQTGTSNLLHQIARTNQLDALTFSPDGRRLAAVNAWGEVDIWDTERWAPLEPVLRPRRGRQSSFNALAFSKDSSTLAVGTPDGTLRVVRLNPRSLIFETDAHPETVSAVAWSPTTPVLATASWPNGGVIRLWNADSGRLVGEMTGHNMYILQLIFSRDGQWLYSASGDHTIRIWDVREPWDKPRQRCFALLRGSTDEVYGLALSPDGTTLASGTKDGVVAFWSAAPNAKAEQPRSLSIGWGWGKTAAFAPDSRVLAVARESTVCLYELEALRELASIEELGTNVTSLAYSPDGTLIVSGSTNGWLRVWSVAERRVVRELQMLPGHTGRVSGLRFSQDGRRLLSGSWSGERVFWDVRTWQRLCSWSSLTPYSTVTSLSPDGRVALGATGERENQLGWWDTATGNLLKTTISHRFIISDADFSADSTRVASVAEDGTLTLWNASSFQATKGFNLKAHPAAFGVAFSPDGRRVATGGSTFRDEVKLWDVDTHRELLTLTGPGGGTLFYLVAFSPDGNWLAACSREGRLHLWRAPSWAEIEASEKGQAQDH